MEPYKKYRDVYLNSVDEILVQDEKEYFVFVYWTICPHCIAAISDVKNYLDGNNPTKLYLLNFTNEDGLEKLKDTENIQNLDKRSFVEEYSKDSVGAKKLSDINYYYVPMLLHIKDKAVYRCVVLEDNIGRYLKENEKD